jgi:hypothetical protein
VQSGNASAGAPGSGITTFSLSGQAALKDCTATWSATLAGTAVTETDQIQVVGGFLFGLAEGRASDTSLSDDSDYTPAELVRARLEVEESLEQICDQAFVPRYRRIVLDGTGRTDLPLPGAEDVVRSGFVLRGVRTIRRISVAPRVDETFVDLTAGQLAAVTVTPDGDLRRTDGNIFTEGNRNVIVEVEHGCDAPPVDLKWAGMQHLRVRLNLNRTAVPDRVLSYTQDGGGTYRIAQAAAYSVGIPEIDAVYDRYSRRKAGTGADGKPFPSSRPLVFTPQRGNLFHGLT